MELAMEIVQEKLDRTLRGNELTLELLKRSKDCLRLSKEVLKLERPKVWPGQLAAPICEACNLEMTWFHAALVAAGKAIRHVFIWPLCDSIGEITTLAQTVSRK